MTDVPVRQHEPIDGQSPADDDGRPQQPIDGGGDRREVDRPGDGAPTEAPEERGHDVETEHAPGADL